MIEQAMYFALGFLVAGLITLLFVPAFWRRATRLSMRRLQMLAPMSMEQVIAERDLLRAEFALRERRLEKDMEALKASKVADLATIGRHAATILDAEAQRKKAEAKARDLELQIRDAQKVLVERTDLLRSTELALHEMTERADRWVERLRLLELDKEELGREKEAHHSRVVAHEARIGALHEQNTQLQHELDALKQEFARISVEAARAPHLSQELARIGADLETASAARDSITKERDQIRAELAKEQERWRHEFEQFENALRIARAEARDSADKLEIARADNAMLQGANEALRAEHAKQRLAGPSSSQADVAALREALISFSNRVVDVVEPARERAG